MNKTNNKLFYKKIIGVILALLLGNFGFHQAYLGKYRLAFVYALFFWTGIPGLIALVEAFYMPGRIERFEQNNIRFELLKFFGYPIGGFLSVFVIGSMFNVMMGKSLFWTPSELNKGNLSNGSTPPRVEKLLGDQLSVDVSSSLIENRKTEEGITTALNLLLTEPEQFYQSQEIANALKKSMDAKDIQFVSELLNHPENLERGHLTRINGGVNTGSLPVSYSHVFSLKVNKEGKTYSIMFDFWKIKNNGVKLGRVLINSKKYNWSPW